MACGRALALSPRRASAHYGGRRRKQRLSSPTWRQEIRRTSSFSTIGKPRFCGHEAFVFSVTKIARCRAGSWLKKPFVGPVRFLEANNRQAAALGAPDEKKPEHPVPSVCMWPQSRAGRDKNIRGNGKVTTPNHWEPRAAPAPFPKSRTIPGFPTSGPGRFSHRKDFASGLTSFPSCMETNPSPETQNHPRDLFIFPFRFMGMWPNDANRTVLFVQKKTAKKFWRPISPDPPLGTTRATGQSTRRKA